MNSTVIANVGGRSVYYLKDNNVAFYINMPDTGVKSVSIGINIVDKMDDINLNISGVEKAKEEITKLYGNFLYNDVVFVTPVMDSNICEQLKLSNNEKIFIYTDKYISYLINQVYNLLARANIEVKNIIKLNNNGTYKVFIDWFVNKYKNRVELIDVNRPDAFSNFNSGNDDIPTSELKEDISIANQVLDNTSDINTALDDDFVPDDNVREPGFVSYVLLGVIVSVVSLVILYMLL